MATLRVVVRDAKSPCKPFYTRFDYKILVYNCDLTLFKVFPCTGAGPGGGKIYGEAEVPQGCYIVVGIAPCENAWTNSVLACVCCDGVTCVNLIPRKFEVCVDELLHGINATSVTPATPQVAQALGQARQALLALHKVLPANPMVAAALPMLKELKADDLVKLLTPE